MLIDTEKVKALLKDDLQEKIDSNRTTEEAATNFQIEMELRIASIETEARRLKP